MRHTDDPWKSSDVDLLNRKEVAHKLGHAIKAYQQDSSFVLGIQGEWGYGKTSFINMLLEPLENHKEKYVIVEFKPWYFSGDHQILRELCYTLAEKIRSHISSPKVEKVAENIKNIASVLEPLETPVNIIAPGFGLILGFATKNVTKIVENYQKAIRTKHEIQNLKNQIQEDMKDFEKRIIIVVDDIDRLCANEIYHLFKLVKIVADFPKTFFILSYDKARVTKALNDMGYDERFIEKIVQEERDVPRHNHADVDQYFRTELEKVITEAEVILTEQHLELYRRFYFNGWKDSLPNLRAAKRVLNTFSTELSILKNEVNPIDLAALSTIKIVANDVYQFIQKYGYAYISGGGLGTKTEYLKNIYKSFYDEQIKKLEMQWALDLTEAMFPTLKGYRV